MRSWRVQRPRYVLPVIVAAQFGGTSLWFATNAVLPQLSAEFAIDGAARITSAVQLGFIVGTAGVAFSGIGDRFSARVLFLVSSIIGAACNLGVLWASDATQVMVLRFGVGVALAGIYPVGMKAAASWFRDGLGTALGFLVGALVVGTALPHLIGSALPWRWTLISVSGLAVLGGLAVFALVPDGPYTRRSPFNARSIPQLFAVREFRASALGYFGHMWELYTFWAFLPALLTLHGELPVSLMAFVVIAAGAVGCVVGGLLTKRFGSGRIARVQLTLSGACCLLLPLAFALPAWAFAAYVIFWGVVVVGDSPQLSTLTARATPPELVGTGLALVTSIGFGLTIVSIEVAGALEPKTALTALVVGPILGVLALRRRGAGSEFQ